jgi:large subunit ribosomal protein L6
MSKIGKQPIKLPSGVSFEVSKGGVLGGSLVKVSGPKGNLELDIQPGIEFSNEDGIVLVSPTSLNSKKNLYGLYRTLVSNMVKGVVDGYSVALEIQGIGFRAEVQGSKLIMKLGFSHLKEIPIPSGIEVAVKDNVQLTLTGIDKQKVTSFAAVVRSQRPPEPYKGKGIRYSGEKVRRKEGKSLGK